MRLVPVASFLASALTITVVASADPPAMGAPPPDAAALVDAPKSSAADAPSIDGPKDETSASVSAGGQLASGNSKLVAFTANGKFDMRRGDNGFGAALLGNYGEGAPPGKSVETTAQNLQGRIRYDRFLLDTTSIFLIATGRHDRFQGLNFRLNIDPGVKYLFVKTDPTAFWGELGYDFQYDMRRSDALVQGDDPTLPLLAKTATDHSARVFIGFKHAFSKEVSFATGVEYLQSFVEGTRARLNYDALFAANIGGGLALGLGFTARYDHAPLPDKKNLDTATTVSLIYSFSDGAAAPAPEPCPPPAPPPPAEPPPVAPAPPAPPAYVPGPAPAPAPTDVPPPAPVPEAPLAPAPANVPAPAPNG